MISIRTFGAREFWRFEAFGTPENSVCPGTSNIDILA